jgi:two-component system CheB/CheR fusion protein
MKSRRTIKASTKAKLRSDAERELRNGETPPEDMKFENLKAAMEELQVYEVELKMQNEELRGGRTLLEESEAKYFGHFDLAPVGFLRVGRDGLIREINVLGAQMLELKRSDLRRAQRPLLLHVAPSAHSTFLHHLDDAFESGKLEMCELALQNPAGTETFVRMQSVRSRGEGGLPELYMTLTDLTERQRIERDLAEQKAVADAALSAQEKFFAMLSHELRTPLTPVLAAVQEMQTCPERSKDDREVLAMMQRNLELEINLIGDLLDLTGIASGKLKLKTSIIDIHVFLRHAIDICRSELRARQIALTTDFRATRHFVKADAHRLQQVFWNLLKNSIKFTKPEGHITVISRDEGGHMSIEIRDDGMGIEPEVLPRIFEPFVQAKRAIYEGYGGLGLGLAIARSLAEAHGGTLDASSDGPGKGASFWVRLPTAPAALSEPEAPPPDVASAPSAKDLRLLLIEDHKDSRRALARILSQRGYIVMTARNAAQARELCAAQEFDVLVSDLNLPDASGLDLFQELNRSHRQRGVALSGFGSEGDVEQCKAAGFLAHLTKPVDIEELDEAIRHALTAG